ncbi:hypothetical protein BSKO_08497 [Bryopsis sp. KO-2023]|nr:hypothetical protein BSKO_08497 [Bryopsis sp. KO-2023]
MNIIFDLDSTLIDAQYSMGGKAAFVMGRQGPAHVCGKELCNLYIYKRPGVDDLLEWCFQNCENVGMWTLSGPKWVDEVLTHVLKGFPRERWSFIWTGERATRLTLQSTRDISADAVVLEGRKVVKDLKKVFRQQGLRKKGYRRNNTIIVEDTPSNCARNYGNGIFVSPFDILKCSTPDRELPMLQKYLETFVLGKDDVREIYKRNWLASVGQLEKKEEGEKKLSAGVSRKTCFWMSQELEENEKKQKLSVGISRKTCFWMSQELEENEKKQCSPSTSPKHGCFWMCESWDKVKTGISSHTSLSRSKKYGKEDKCGPAKECAAQKGSWLSTNWSHQMKEQFRKVAACHT